MNYKSIKLVSNELWLSITEDKDPTLIKYLKILTEFELIHISNNKLIKINPPSKKLFFTDLTPRQAYLELPEFSDIRKIFPNLQYFIACFKSNLNEPPKCPWCGKTVGIRGNELQKTCLDKKCSNKQRKSTCFEIYGGESSTCSDVVKEKSKQTWLKKYGVDNPSKSEKIQLKKEITCLSHYGTKYPTQSEEVKIKIKNTVREKFGVDNVAYSSEIRKKIEETNKKNHEGVWNNQLESDKIKRAETNRRNHGGLLECQTEEGKEKRRKTNLEKYGVEHPSQNPVIMEKSLKNKKHSRKKYYFDNIGFDSKEELSFYIYHKDLNNNIIREPKLLKYNFNNKEYFYKPDFEVNGQLFEIKGNWAYNWKGDWTIGVWEFKSLYKKYSNDLETFKKIIIEKQQRIKAKQRCAEENGVKILTADNLYYIMDYCKNKFGKSNWYENFKKK